MKTLLPEEFIELSEIYPVIDVRSPAEFENGHIPGAYSIPLFNNEERAQVGTRYKKSGKENAVELGLKIVGPKMYDFVRQAKKIAVDKQVFVHCWRGGMRSASMAWLFETAGLQASVLKGGYKGYRRHIRSKFEDAQKLIILSGYTGSGKTDVLKSLQALGEQMVDLEGLAHHKGSAYGSIGELPQPTNEQFENNLAKVWKGLDMTQRIWLEDESRSIGRNVIPENLFTKMRNASVIRIEIPREVRVKRLVGEYANDSDNEILSSLQRLKKSLGGKLQLAIEALEQKDYETVTHISLDYYDRAYLKGLNKRAPETILSIPVLTDTPNETAKILMEQADLLKF